MKNKYCMSLVLGTALLATAPSMAREAAIVSASEIEEKCPMKETATLSVRFNIASDSIAKAKAEYDKRVGEVSKYAKEQKIDKIIISNISYNLNSNRRYNRGYDDVPTSYKLNGSATYNLANSADAFKLADFLEKKKFNVRINYSGRRETGGNCYKMLKNFK